MEKKSPWAGGLGLLSRSSKLSAHLFGNADYAPVPTSEDAEIPMTATAMNKDIRVEKGEAEIDALEESAPEDLQKEVVEAKPRGYVAATDEERRLDKAVNLRMDIVIISVCAIDFLVHLELRSPLDIG
jgi:hypothetical protein